MKLKLFNKGYVHSKEVDKLKDAISTRDNEIANLRKRVSSVNNDKIKFERKYIRCDNLVRDEQNRSEKAPLFIEDLEKRQSSDEIMKLLKAELFNKHVKILESERSKYITNIGGILVTPKIITNSEVIKTEVTEDVFEQLDAGNTLDTGGNISIPLDNINLTSSILGC